MEELGEEEDVLDEFLLQNRDKNSFGREIIVNNLLLLLLFSRY